MRKILSIILIIAIFALSVGVIGITNRTTGFITKLLSGNVTPDDKLAFEDLGTGDGGILSLVFNNNVGNYKLLSDGFSLSKPNLSTGATFAAYNLRSGGNADNIHMIFRDDIEGLEYTSMAARYTITLEDLKSKIVPYSVFSITHHESSDGSAAIANAGTTEHIKIYSDGAYTVVGLYSGGLEVKTWHSMSDTVDVLYLYDFTDIQNGISGKIYLNGYYFADCLFCRGFAETSEVYLNMFRSHIFEILSDDEGSYSLTNFNYALYTEENDSVIRELITPS